MSTTVTCWRAIRPALIKVFTQAACDQITSPGGVNVPMETPAFTAEWQNRRVTMMHPGQGFSLFLHIATVIGKGWDDEAYTMLDTGLAAGLPASGVFDVFETTSGLRRCNLQARVECVQDDEELSSFDIVERMRARLAKNSLLQQLLAVNVDLTDVGTARDLSSKRDKKVMSITSLDCVFTACIIDTDPVPTGWIEQVIVTSHTLDGDQALPDPMQMINETLPPDEG